MEDTSASNDNDNGKGHVNQFEIMASNEIPLKEGDPFYVAILNGFGKADDDSEVGLFASDDNY